MPTKAGQIVSQVVPFIGPALGAGINAIFQGKSNRKSRKFAEKMYYQQRNDALAFWNAQNAYNTPAAQMQRFKAAGLNPNLIYGRGSSGEAGSINVPNQPRWNPTAPHLNLAEISNQFYNSKLKAAQVGLLQKEAALKDAQKIATLVTASTGKFDLGLKIEARNSLLQALQSKGPSAVQSYTGQLKKNALMDQSFKFLAKYNDRQLAQISAQVRLLKSQRRLTAANLTARLKNNHLIGISDKTEIGSLVRAILTIFNQDPSSWSK